VRRVVDLLDGQGNGVSTLQYSADLENHLAIADRVYDSSCTVASLRTIPGAC
jgi:hypothetical protein